MAGLFLGIFGISISLFASNISWLNKLRFDIVLLIFFAALIIGIPIHQQYHLFSLRLLGYQGKINWGLTPSLEIKDPVPKWAAVGILLAPVIDLTLIILLMFYFLPDVLSPLSTAFYVCKMVGSGNDLVMTIYIRKLAQRNSMIRFTPEG